MGAEAGEALAAQVRAEQAAWRDLVAEVGDDRMDEPGPMGEWTFRDLVVHLLGWRDRTIRRLEAVAAGQPDPPEAWPADLSDDDAVNDWIQTQGEDRSVPDLLRAADVSYDHLAAALASIPPSILEDPNGIAWLDGEAAVDVDWLSHLHDEHDASIREWLEGRD
jgi:Mycothiol maleylpyruvate isomerase N-terminal domain